LEDTALSQLELVTAERQSEASLTGAAYGAFSSPVLANTDFIAGKKYLIICRGEVKCDVTTFQPRVRLMHGSTVFPGSECIYTVQSINDRIMWHYMTVWTAVSGEDISMQGQGNGTDAVRLRFTTLTAIRLSDTLVENTDWRYAEGTTALTLTTTATDVTGATLTFTPATAGHRWLIIADGEVELDVTGSNQFCLSLVESGGASATWEAVYGGRASGDTRQLFHYAVVTLGAVSQTFKVQARRIGTTASTARCVRAAVFAIDLDKFDVATVGVDDTHIDATTSVNFNTLSATASHTQAIDGGNVLLIGYQSFDFLTQTSTTAYDTARVQQDNVDAYSADGVLNTYTDQSGLPRFVNPAGIANNVFPYVHHSVEQMTAAVHNVDLDFGVSATGNKGVKFRRMLAISLDVATPPPPAGSGGGQGELEISEAKMYVNDYRASRRRVPVRCVDATDNATPEIGEAAGQGGISVNGTAFSTTGVGVLVAVEASNGLYYSELTQNATRVVPGSAVRFRYKSAATAIFSRVVLVEECPWLDDGAAAGGGANYIDLEATTADRTIPVAAAIPAGSIIRLLSGTGAGQSQVVTSYNGSRATMEQNWGTNPVAGTIYEVLPGLPPVTPAVNVAQVNASPTAAVNLQIGADAVQSGAVVSGTNTVTTVTTNLPITVGGVTTPTDHWRGRTVYFTSGPLKGDQAAITGSAVSGANTVLTVDLLAQVPSVGNTFILT
jgi:hypothetical protein